ncbi:XRE family transcriptional regulator [Staphylococcus saprophyticus]|uniref:XRE family transcriptional regulator n=1 Tax=Staphylococcus saprophyticus TaxID=29385 RepID=UPI0019331A01|nr:XRE family transcriptional regulator [Staphylococcus saprophyticus]MBM0844816.1 XRE family transcriptional regulator [Staphylococcus saprophyticus]
MEKNHRNKVIAANIKKLIKENKISQKELASNIDISPSTLSDYLNLRSNPSHGVIQRIANYFGVMKSDIDSTYRENNDITEIYNKLEEKRKKRVLAYAEHHYSVQQQGESIIYLQSYKDSKTEEVTVNGYVSAGTGETLVDDIEFTVNYPAGVVPPHDFALQVNGDSMEPLFEHKEIIFVEENTSINSGQLGVFVVDGEAYVKKVFIYQDHIRLVSLNPKYGDMNFYGDSDVRFAGRVIL